MNELSAVNKDGLAIQIGAKVKQSLASWINSVAVEKGSSFIVVAAIEVQVGYGGLTNDPPYDITIHIGQNEDGTYAEH